MTDTAYSHTGLSMGDTRHYRVSAINVVGTSPVSNTASATAVATPPGLSSAVVERTNSLVVRLEFDELVDTTSVPDKSAFAVKVEGTPREVTSFTITDAGRLGWLGLASSVRPGETVTLSYTKPGRTRSRMRRATRLRPSRTIPSRTKSRPTSRNCRCRMRRCTKAGTVRPGP